MTNFFPDNIDEPHLAEFRDSAIADDIAALNFRSWIPDNENDLDEAFTLLIEEPEHNNNGTLAGQSQKYLANTMRSGGWIFEGYKGYVSSLTHLERLRMRTENGKISGMNPPEGKANYSF
jgi:hypothetical protein